MTCLLYSLSAFCYVTQSFSPVAVFVFLPLWRDITHKHVVALTHGLSEGEVLSLHGLIRIVHTGELVVVAECTLPRLNQCTDLSPDRKFRLLRQTETKKIHCKTKENKKILIKTQHTLKHRGEAVFCKHKRGKCKTEL